MVQGSLTWVQTPFLPLRNSVILGIWYLVLSVNGHNYVAQRSRLLWKNEYENVHGCTSIFKPFLYHQVCVCNIYLSISVSVHILWRGTLQEYSLYEHIEFVDEVERAHFLHSGYICFRRMKIYTTNQGEVSLFWRGNRDQHGLNNCRTTDPRRASWPPLHCQDQDIVVSWGRGVSHKRENHMLFFFSFHFSFSSCNDLVKYLHSFLEMIQVRIVTESVFCSTSAI